MLANVDKMFNQVTLFYVPRDNNNGSHKSSSRTYIDELINQRGGCI